MPCKRLRGCQTAGRNPLDTGPLLQGCALTRQSGGGVCTFPVRVVVDLDAELNTVR